MTFPHLPAIHSHPRAAPAVWLGSLLLAWGEWQSVAFGSQVFLRLSVALVVLLYLPGALMNRLLRIRAAGWLERIALCVGLSLGVHAVGTVVTQELQLSVDTYWIALGTVLATGTVLVLFRPGSESCVPPGPAELSRGESPSSSEPSAPVEAPVALRWLAVALLAALFVIFYRTGGIVKDGPTEEEVLHLALVRKIAENPTLTSTNFMYLPETPSTYLYAPYHFLLALVARVSHVDPVTVFLKVRPFFMVVALGCLVSVLRLVKPDPYLATVGLLVLETLLMTNMGGQVASEDGNSWYYWAQLAPLGHLGDFALGVLLPLLLYFTVKYLTARDRAAAHLGALLLVAVAATIVHIREIVQILLYLALWGAAAAVLLRDKRLVWRCGIAMIVIIATGFTYKTRHHQVVRHIQIHEKANKQQVLENLKQVRKGRTGGFFKRETYFHDPLLHRHLFALWILASPLLLLWVRRPWAFFLGTLVVGFIVIFRIPWLAYTYVKFTYSEILVTPLRNITLPIYLLTSLGCYALVLLVERAVALQNQGARFRPAAFWIVIDGFAVSALLWRFLAQGAGTFVKAQNNLFYFGFFGLLAAILASGKLFPRWRERLDRLTLAPLPVLPAGLRTLAVAGVLAGLATLQSPPSLWAQFRLARGGPHPVTAAKMQSWYQLSPLEKQLPYAMVDAVKTHVLPGSVVAYDFQGRLALPVMANVYVVASGYCFSTDVGRFVDVVRAVRREPPLLIDDPWREYLQRGAYCLQTMQESSPLFSKGYTSSQQLEFLSRFGVDYLIAGYKQHPHLLDLVEEYPRIFREIIAVTRNEERYGLWEIRRADLANAVRRAPSDHVGAGAAR